MKYYLVHITCLFTSCRLEDEILVKGDSENIEVKASKCETDGKGHGWQLGDDGFPFHANVYRLMKKAIKNGVYITEASSLDDLKVKYEARELTDEEAAMILFIAERMYD